MKQFLQKNKYQLLLVLLISYLFFVNYVPGTYLSGWDNLQTDLYPWLGVKRAFFSVWQEYQSFGLVAGMAHAADLIRALFIFILSIFLSENLIRYTYHFFIIGIGSLGMFYFLKNILFNKKNELLAFVGALFYLLNIGAIQNLYFPYEPFTHFWASFPWLVYIFLTTLKSFNRKNLLFFFLINLLASPSFYVQTIFIVYALSLLIITSALLIKLRVFLASTLKKASILCLLIFLINSFWLFPQSYFFLTARTNPLTAKNNQLANNVTIFQNYSRGTLADFLTLKGYYWDLKGNDGQFLFQTWRDHLASPAVWLIQIVLVFIVIIGFFSNNKARQYLIPLFLIDGLFLLSNTLIFDNINLVLRTNSLFDQVFRSSFTKIIVPHSFVMSSLFVLGLELVVRKVKNNLVVYFLITIIALYSLPSFRGSFISPLVKIRFPPEYQALRQYFKENTAQARITVFPDYTHWGWFTHAWGYYGSGFLWYTIEQPIVSRTFDVWSEKSESYFWEIRKAIMDNNKDLFNHVLDKYNITYLIYDSSIKPVAADPKALNDKNLDQLFNNNEKIKEIKEFSFLKLYQYKISQSTQNYISVTDNLKNIGPKVSITDEDQAFLENSSYLSNNKAPFEMYYPFLDLQSFNRAKISSDFIINENNNNLNVKTSIPSNFKEIYKPPDPAIFDIYKNNAQNSYTLVPQISFDKNFLLLKFDKASLLPSNFALTTKDECQKDKKNNNLIYNDDGLKLKNSNDSKSCFGYHFNYLPQKYGYLVKINSENIKGLPLSLNIIDQTNKQLIIDDRLVNGVSYYIIPPVDTYGLGFSINFANESYLNSKSENILKEVDVFPFPYNWLKSVSLINDHKIQQINGQPPNLISTNKYNYFFYKVIVETQNKPTALILYQSFDPGWLAFVNGKILDHVLVNNWANGWTLRPSTTLGTSEFQGAQKIVIIFWPQYLEFFGFGLLILTFLLILRLPNQSPYDRVGRE